MMQMTEKKAKRLEEGGAELVGFIYRSKDGELAYVEGAAVRWLDADQRAAFMFPHDKSAPNVPKPDTPPHLRINEDSHDNKQKCHACNDTGLISAGGDLIGTVNCNYCPPKFFK